MNQNPLALGNLVRALSLALCFLALSASAATARDCYAPTPDEMARYQTIAGQLAASGVRPPAAPAPVSEDDMAWAYALQNAVQSGVRASEAELARYEDIYRRSQPPLAAPEANGPAPSGAPVSAEDLVWAQSLQTRVQAGETPSDADMVRYRDIFERHQAAAPSPPSRDALPVSEADITWALALESRVQETCSAP